MINEAPVFMIRGMLEWMIRFWFVGIWFLLIVLPILYVVHSIKQRRKIIAELEQLAKEVHSLRQQVKEIQKDTGQDQC